MVLPYMNVKYIAVILYLDAEARGNRPESQLGKSSQFLGMAD
jgi:hypothetical protein